MSEDPPEYRIGYKQPPLHSRFKKGQSGNPEGGRRQRPRHTHLPALIEEALDARMAGPRHRPLTRRQAIVVGLVEKSAAGDLRAVKLLFDLMLKTEPADPPPTADAEDARQVLLRRLARLAAEQGTEDGRTTAPSNPEGKPASRG